MKKNKSSTKKTLTNMPKNIVDEEITFVGAMKNVGMSIHKDSQNGGGPVTIVVHKKS